ncbi:hypothetical protein [uncultured Aquimarina sp.]|uniref:hypothetical protein n=1 Tax=uncultured Aquimarina sp. TaxID=575652 RepID=UPI002612C35C|nr:hypothetical protein [uncultured Aquimarina sp.]
MNNKKHPHTKKYRIQTVLDFAEESGVKIFFPKGYYGINLVINSRENLKFYFDKAEFSFVGITDELGKRSKNIKFEGTLILYNRFGTYNSSNIKLDTLILKSDTTRSIEKLRNKGCHIYKGTKDVSIKYLEIEDLGSGDLRYQNNHAALAIDGERNNPENIKIDKTVIKSSDRHGAYVTGTGHYFGEIIIEEYGIGDVDGMTFMQDANKGDEKILSGLWINRCGNSTFNKVLIKTKDSKQGFPLKLDEGKTDQPTFINELNLDVPYKDTLVVDHVLTNILVKDINILDD